MTVTTAAMVRRKRRSGRPIWQEPPTPAGRVGKALLLALVVLAVVFPLWVVVITSLSSQQTIDATGGLVVVPQGITPAAYLQIFSGGVVTRAVLVSTFITAAGTALSLAVTALSAYGLSRPGSLWHRPLLFAVLLTFLFGPGIIPSYLVVKSLGLIDTYASLIIPTAINAFNLVVLRAFFMNIPGELIDSARIDGAGDFTILRRIVLPLSKAALAVIGLFYAVGYWNAFFNAMLYINTTEKWPLQLVLRLYVVNGAALPSGGSSGPQSSIAGMAPAPTLSLKMAIIVIAAVPALLIYPFVQRHFTKGVIVGAVKG
ncbi:carbohydrate ABC transporter permease [Micromonospora sp. CPCC 206061]|uniref:carbohydrate ABC transporter permease n=1 Tax=Micromonospora sp. CPCC 206061 TaxID=3122410 RepID=UPI002FF260CD